MPWLATLFPDFSLTLRKTGISLTFPDRGNPDIDNIVRYLTTRNTKSHHDDVIKWKHFPRYWPFVRGIHWSPVNSPHKGQWRGDLILSFVCAWINGWVNNGETGYLRRYRAHYDVTVMFMDCTPLKKNLKYGQGHKSAVIVTTSIFQCTHMSTFN